MNKRLFKLLSFVFMLVLALPLAAKSAFAETASTEAATGTPKAVVATITDFRVEDRFGNPTTVVNKANVYAIAMTWDASANANVEPGDYFDVTLPNEMRFTAAHPASTFNITDAATGAVPLDLALPLIHSVFRQVPVSLLSLLSLAALFL